MKTKPVLYKFLASILVATLAVAPGVGAPGVGVAPANLGGPVNRVGAR